ncbi:MAG: FAD-dependent oxidoreductase [Berryella intestinalis]|uniref:FAD-dependent oxidoreductase n=1 Tax=Berryella intestinalis TaxID=1531429 RepID=UPI002A502E2F|nr:FAD-dependent oxidoreductase [Berryella intestinalis]MDD7368544.1 FAD-dependent oxidoreductase [Berryella intestinalis]MDY3129109.1 FAD-dependent oxidoreductase [Berryella intestinalis]
MNKGISRRDLFKFGGVAAVGAAGAAALGDCSPKVAGSSAKEEAASTVLEGYCAPDGGWLGSAPDVKATSTVDCDVLVAGSGHAGIQAALAAAEGGAKVVVVDLVTEENRRVKGEDIGHVNSQWLIDQGYGPYNVGEATAEFVKRTAGRVNPEIIRKFVANSGEMFDHTAALVQWPDSRIKVAETADPQHLPARSQPVHLPGARHRRRRSGRVPRRARRLQVLGCGRPVHGSHSTRRVPRRRGVFPPRRVPAVRHPESPGSRRRVA